jgi:hypothetical protein
VKKKCPTCSTEIEKFWKSSVGGVILGFCRTCKRKVNLGKADGTNSAPGPKAGEKEAGQKKEKEGGKGSRGKAASGSSRKQPVAKPPISPEPAKKPGGFISVREFFGL